METELYGSQYIIGLVQNGGRLDIGADVHGYVIWVESNVSQYFWGLNIFIQLNKSDVRINTQVKH